MKLEIIENSNDYREWLKAMLIENWGSEKVVSKGQLLEPLNLPGLIAVSGKVPVGYLSYRIEGNQCEVVTLKSASENVGVGSNLLAHLKGIAQREGCTRIWLITTNDNTPAMRFYQKQGFNFVAVYRNALAVSRKLKRQIPMTGIDGITITDELEMEMLLQPI